MTASLTRLATVQILSLVVLTMLAVACEAC